MLCDRFLDKVAEFREGLLDEETQIYFEAHRIDCARCQKALLDEEKIAAMISDVPGLKASPDFRDRVLREWRLRRDKVTDTLPVETLKRVQIVLWAVVAGLLFLPMVRESLQLAASRLSGALERLPVESRERIPITVEIPTWAEISATLQVWQGNIFGALGEFGTAVAPWTGWLLAAVVVAVIIAVANYYWMRSRIDVQSKSKERI